MATCSTCGLDGIAPASPCPTCGSMPIPELDARPVAAPVARAPRTKKIEEPAALELAIDPRDLVKVSAPPPPSAAGALGSFPPPPAPLAPRRASIAPPRGRSPLDASDPLGDARVLADYPQPPTSVALTPLYAWKVVQRQRKLRAALATRAIEADHAQTALDDALVAFAERARPGVGERVEYAPALQELVAAEATLRSRDQVLAAEQDAQRTRLAQADGRIARAEAELGQAQEAERLVATELAGVQSALAREEAKLKRAQTELKSAQERPAPAVAG